MQRGSGCAFLFSALWHGSFHLPVELPPVCFARPTRSTRCARSILLLPVDAPCHVLAVLRALHVLQTSWEEWPQQYGYQHEPRYAGIPYDDEEVYVRRDMGRGAGAGGADGGVYCGGFEVHFVRVQESEGRAPTTPALCRC